MVFIHVEVDLVSRYYGEPKFCWSSNAIVSSRTLPYLCYCDHTLLRRSFWFGRICPTLPVMTPHSVCAKSGDGQSNKANLTHRPPQLLFRVSLFISSPKASTFRISTIWECWPRLSILQMTPLLVRLECRAVTSQECGSGRNNNMPASAMLRLFKVARQVLLFSSSPASSRDGIGNDAFDGIASQDWHFAFSFSNLFGCLSKCTWCKLLPRRWYTWLRGL